MKYVYKSLRSIHPLQNVLLSHVVWRSVHNVVAPQLPDNSFHDDPLLPRLVKSIYEQHGTCSKATYNDLHLFGMRCKELNELAQKCEMYPPRLQRLDGWGSRVDNVMTCDAWDTLHQISSEEGLVAIGHDNNQHLKEVHQSIKLLLFGGVSGMVSCPLAMTDGAATTLTRLLNQHVHCQEGSCDICSEEWRRIVKNAITRLTSRDPDTFWTSGQWMTERLGGSDVTKATQTYAQLDSSGVLRLYGNKFYTSAIDCSISLTLAKYQDKLSLFLVHLPDKYDGTIQIEKLKDKLGTRQLPTAELSLEGVPATLLAERGIANIIPMLHITRLYNSIMASSYLRHITNLAKSFAKTRSAFGTELESLPLHRTTLAKIETFARAITVQSVDLALVLNNKIETPSLSANVNRALSAVVKVHTAYVAINTVREGLECFGGAGYMEDTGLPGILRDACVLPVWEGTTDVLSAETMRALQHEGCRTDTLRYIRELVIGWCGFGGVQHVEFPDTPHPQLEAAAQELNMYLSQLELVMDKSEHMGRTVTLGLGSAHAAATLINLARYSGDESDVAAAVIWCQIGLYPLYYVDKADIRNVLN